MCNPGFMSQIANMPPIDEYWKPEELNAQKVIESDSGLTLQMFKDKVV